jgi:hypothetical protein
MVRLPLDEDANDWSRICKLTRQSKISSPRIAKGKGSIGSSRQVPSGAGSVEGRGIFVREVERVGQRETDDYMCGFINIDVRAS